MTQLHIFVSHSSQDTDFGDVFVRSLRDAGANVWYDQYNLGPGPLTEEIMRELYARRVFHVLLSPAAFASTWVKQESLWAYNLAKGRDTSKSGHMGF
jgi:hypothetical protein